MKSNTLFFSPTQTGATVCQAIQSGLTLTSGESIDLPRVIEPKTFGADDVVIISMPVYSGRLPTLAVEQFKKIQGGGALAVVVVMYGNRAFDDALLELSDLCAKQGFSVIASAAFIGVHSFSMPKFPIAVGRPDASDLQKAAEFGALVQKKMDSGEERITPSVPGNHPYKDAMNPMGAIAESDAENCIQCGLCETFCPSHAITLTKEGPQTDAEKCIGCTACVKVCTSHARKITMPKIYEIAERLHNACQTRQEPEWFLK